MLKNYLKTILRNSGRNPVYSFINIAGFAIGLAACLIIGLFVKSELSYDRFHEDADRMYRVVQDEAGEEGLAWSGPQMGLKLVEDFPQIERVMRVIDGGNGYGSDALISYEDAASGEMMRFNESGFLYADPGFFDFFSFQLMKGSVGDVLSSPGHIVLSESTAQKYFGEENPVGKIILLSNRYPLEVTGVAADPPQNSHLDFNFVASYPSFYTLQGIAGEIDSFWWPPTHTYIKLQPNASANVLNDQLPAFSRRHRDADDASRLTPVLQPLTEIWLGHTYRGQQQVGGTMVYIYLFSAVAVFILVLACVNFMNLATARAGKRAKEIGVRKTLGAARNQLTAQFLVESVLVSLISFMLALFLAEISLPYFNSIAAKQMAIPYENTPFWVLMLIIVLGTGILAGSYPALYLSGFRVAKTIKVSVSKSLAGSVFRKGLVVFQFAISMILLMGAAVVYQQLQFANQVSIGFDKEYVAVLPGYGLSGNADNENSSRYEILRSELLNQSGVLQVAAVGHQPGISNGSIYVWEAEGLPSEPNRQFPAQFVGEDFFEMLNVEITAGRPLRADDPADIGTTRIRSNQSVQAAIHENRAIVLNETAARRLGWTAEEAIGKQIRFYISENDNIYQDYRGNVVGVIEDYHTTSIHQSISPVAYMSAKAGDGDYVGLSNILVKLAPGNFLQARQTLQQVWEQVVPERPFELTFLDERLNALYSKEIRLGKLITGFTILAVFIACLGLFGLSSYTTETRTKEIGIRKTLGATTSQIVLLLSKDFVKLVMIGFIIAVPIAWFSADLWLQNFVYRVSIGWKIFALTGAVALVLAMITVSWQSIKAALMNPVKSLRSE